MYGLLAMCEMPYVLGGCIMNFFGFEVLLMPAITLPCPPAADLN